MRILMLTTNASLQDGINRHILSVAPALNARGGVEVAVCTVMPRGEFSVALERAGIPKDMLKTCTFDNGKEFAFFKQLEQALGIKGYFVKPYHSWERGTNENCNGIVRKILPKGSAFDAILDEEMRRIDRMLNDRPLKCRDWRTPRARRSRRSCTAICLPRPDAASLFEMAFGAHQAKPSAEARLAGLTGNCYTTNQSQESTCLTMLRNECCVGYWKAGCECDGMI